MTMVPFHSFYSFIYSVDPFLLTERATKGVLHMERRHDLMIGIWKFFEPRVSYEELTTFAEELAKDPNFTQLYIRRTSTDQLGIGFTYKYAGSKEEYDRVKDMFGKLLTNKFGRNYVGNDMTASPIVIKGF